MNNSSKKTWAILAMAFFISLIVIGVCYGCEHHEPDVDQALVLRDLDKVKIESGVPSFIKQYEGFTVSFNEENHTPNYVAWELTSHETSGESSRTNNFWSDPTVPGCADTRDYTRSGYDRGHLCPAADQKWSDQAMHDSFVMTNICPQANALNTGAWNTLENKERQWAARDSMIVIVAGPIYTEEDQERIGNIGVRVPSSFFKVMLAPYAKPMRAIGFVYPNMKSPGNMADYATTVDEVERITGLDFFHTLPDDVESEVESSATFRDWNQR